MPRTLRPKRNMALRIGELLLKEQRITPEQLQEALAYQKAHGGKLGAALVQARIRPRRRHHGPVEQAVPACRP